jgi:hypothetical protein
MQPTLLHLEHTKASAAEQARKAPMRRRTRPRRRIARALVSLACRLDVEAPKLLQNEAPRVQQLR